MNFLPELIQKLGTVLVEVLVMHMVAMEYIMFVQLMVMMERAHRTVNMERTQST